MKTNTEPTASEEPGNLDALAAEAASLEADAQAQENAPSKADTQQAANLESELLAALQLVRGIAGPLCHWMTLERFERTWSNERIRAMAEPGAIIMQLNGWTVGAMLGKWGPYIALTAAMGAPTLETIRAYKDASAIAAAQPATGGGHGDQASGD